MIIENIYIKPEKVEKLKMIYPGSQFSNSIVTDAFELYEYNRAYYLKNLRTEKFFKITLSVLDKSLSTIKGENKINPYLLFKNIGYNFFDLR